MFKFQIKRTTLLLCFCISFFLHASTAFAHINFELTPHKSILELKKIDIPGHPFAFNPSIARWREKIIMSFREVIHVDLPSISSGATSQIGLVCLNEEFEPISRVFLLDFDCEYSRIDDPRLLTIDDVLYITYSDNTDPIVSDERFRMWTAKIEEIDDELVVQEKQKLSYYEGENPQRREKNWIPFSYDNRLHLVYSISPHKVFEPIEGTNCCLTAGSTKTNAFWPWGEPRGGTPAVDINGRYLSFFHSFIEIPSMHSDGEVMAHYFMGAYTFSNEPPFAVTHISRKPLVANGFYSGAIYPYYWKPVRVVFPCGILLDENTIWVTYGRQDHEIWIAKFDRTSLLNSLIPLDE